jgi:serine-type D-Ala-D-Ala endopeptidase (penicillin-binding protein 7)
MDLCYNADTPCKRLSIKGLNVNRTRLLRYVRPFCVVAAVLAFGPTAQTAAGQASAKPAAGAAAPKKLTLKKKKTAYSAASARARRAALARARAATQAKLLREAQEPRFKLDDLGALVPDIRAEAAIIYNPENGQVLWESNSQNQRSIASITKVMTAAVVLEDAPDMATPVAIQRSDVLHASTTYLRSGDQITREDLLHLLLIASDNAAARALARSSAHGSQGFVERMNVKAKELGLTNTSYADPSGLLATNVSSAYDMAKLITYVSGDSRIASVMQKQNYTATASRRTISIHSTNQLVGQTDFDVRAGKTGFISKAGYCLATLLRLPQGGPQVAVVVLGAKSNAGRFWETRHLFNWLSSKAKDLIGTPVEAASVAAPTAP